MVITLAGVAIAQQPPAWHADLAEQLVGKWKLEGNVMGQAAHHTLPPQWVLGRSE
jgi:hypothetical protein